MTVQELINDLSRRNPDALVVIDDGMEIKNLLTVEDTHDNTVEGQRPTVCLFPTAE